MPGDPDHAAKAAQARQKAQEYRQTASDMQGHSHRRAMLLRLANDQDRKAACYQQMIDLTQRVQSLDRERE